jgi:hypothetical protein
MRRVLGAALAVTLSAGVAQAQPADYLVGVSLFKVKPGQGPAFLAAARQALQGPFEKLAAQGAVLAWGFDTADSSLHHPNVSTHSLWVAMPSLRTQDLLDAALASSPALSQLASLVEPDGHVDLMLRSVLSTARPASGPGTRFLLVRRYRVERGKEAEWRAFFAKHYQPVLDSLVADGTLEGHGLMLEELIGSEPGTQWHWTRATSREAIGKMLNAFGPVIAKLTPAERSIMQHEMRSLIVPGSVHDDVWKGDFFPGAAPAK